MSSRPRLLPYGKQTIDADDIAAVAAALHGDFLTTGPLVAAFEAEFAKATGAKYAVACNSGTAALHLATLALDIGPGDTVIVPTLTFLATANAVRMAGAEVVFADVDPDTGLLTPQTFERALASAGGGNAKAAIPVHLNGQLCAIAEIAMQARRTNIALIEDSCHALGVPGIGATPHSHVQCFSTHPVKAITTGEGGIATTEDGMLATRMQSLRTHGMIRDSASFKYQETGSEATASAPWYYEMQEIGWNYRLPDVLCALGISQLKKLKAFHERRLAISALYDRLFLPLAPALIPVPHANAQHGWHIYAILVDFDLLNTTRARFMAALRAAGIGTQVHYIPVHSQPYYRDRYGALDMPGAEAYYRRCLSIPMFPAMTDEDVMVVADKLAMLVRA